MTAHRALSWPGSHLRHIGLACLAALASLVVNVFWMPTLDPVMPAELSGADADSALRDKVWSEGGGSLDFIVRPLFLVNRRPPEEMAVAPPAVDVEPADEASVVALDSYALIGIFASGDLAGVILKDAQDNRYRLYVGETLEGWRLTGTSLRAARFEDGTGRPGGLELTVASSLPAPEAVSKPETQEGDTSTSRQQENRGSNQTDGVESTGGRLTFEAVAQRQRRQRQQDQEAAGGKADN